jgi:hypothetical protein
MADGVDGRERGAQSLPDPAAARLSGRCNFDNLEKNIAKIARFSREIASNDFGLRTGAPVRRA